MARRVWRRLVGGKVLMMTVSLSAMVWFFGLRRVVDGVWCVVNGVRRKSTVSTYFYLPNTYIAIEI